MIKKYSTVIFDMGNVLIDFYPSQIVAHFTQDPRESELLIREIFLSQEWHDLDLNLITDQAAASSICLRLPQEHHELIHRILSEWPATITTRDEMIPLIKQLSEHQIKLYLASNASIRFYEYQSAIKALDYFNGILISAEIHHGKPERIFYETLLARFHLLPKECPLIDDLPANIEGATQCGIDGIVYDGKCETLLRFLQRTKII